MAPTTADGNRHSLHRLWNRRHCTKFNGVSYPVQRAAEAVYSGRQVPDQGADRLLLANADIDPRPPWTNLGYDYVGGDNSPYIWIDGRRIPGTFLTCCSTRPASSAPPGPDSANAASGYIRISAFNSHDKGRRGDAQSVQMTSLMQVSANFVRAKVSLPALHCY